MQRPHFGVALSHLWCCRLHIKHAFGASRTVADRLLLATGWGEADISRSLWRYLSLWRLAPSCGAGRRELTLVASVGGSKTSSSEFSELSITTSSERCCFFLRRLRFALVICAIAGVDTVEACVARPSDRDSWAALERLTSELSSVFGDDSFRSTGSRLRSVLCTRSSLVLRLLDC